MPDSVNRLSFRLLLCVLLWPLPAAALDYAARIRYADLVETADGYSLKTEIAYRLSPTAREALHKGVPLAWDVKVEIDRVGLLWNATVYRKTLSYSLQFHALLNQYEVKTPGQSEMFLSLGTALNFMALLQDEVNIDNKLLQPGQRYQLRLKTRFNRELLPIPLRPVAYLDSEWFLSSNWFVWPIQK
ncbi:MAG: DUF4390 domain-containing protein [Methylococcales bacterium]|nr:DUF4390 domain-containing protein [Methylococcales bacterium]